MTKKIAKHYQTVKIFHPDFMEAVGHLGKTAKNAGPLDMKTAHLIQLAASIAIRSEEAANSHTKKARDEGATPEEIRHTVMILTNALGFPNVRAGMSWLNDIIVD
ncbi:MAG: carboxymuconolactone decarboxylase family protein [Bacteroidota bacterium]